MELDKYRSERRAPSTEQIEIPQLAAYFPQAKPLFTVRNLSAAEYGRCREAGRRNSDKAALVGALLGGDADAKADALKQITAGPEIPDDIAERIEMFAIACVEPELQHSDAVLISEDLPMAFYQLTNKITALTQVGRVLGKPKPSGKNKTSELP